jgi:hypothetical protein
MLSAREVSRLEYPLSSDSVFFKPLFAMHFKFCSSQHNRHFREEAVLQFIVILFSFSRHKNALKVLIRVFIYYKFIIHDKSDI